MTFGQLHFFFNIKWEKEKEVEEEEGRKERKVFKSEVGERELNLICCLIDT